MVNTRIFSNNQTPSTHNLPERQRIIFDHHNPQYRSIRDRVTKQDNILDHSTIDQIRNKSKRVLLHVKTVFPFKLFPTHIIVDINRIIVIDQTFLFADTIRSFPVGNIQYVRCDRSIFFGSLRIRTYGFSDREVMVKFLWNRDAIRVRRLIEGLIICHEENIDPMEFKDNICGCLEKLGTEHFQ